MFRFIKAENIEKSSQDYNSGKKLTIGQTGKTFGISIFGNGFAIDEAFEDILKDYDTDNNNILDENEVQAFKKAVSDAAGDDNILDEKELNRLFTKSEKTTEFSEKSSALFKALVVTLQNGAENLKVYTHGEDRSISSIKEDGSGVRASLFKIRSSNDDGYRVEIFSQGGKRKELITCTNCDLREGSDISPKEGNFTSHVIYDDSGKVKEQSGIYHGDERINPYTEHTFFEYSENGKLVKKYNTHNNMKSDYRMSEITRYGENDNIIEKYISTQKNGLNRTELMKYNSDGGTIISKKIKKEKQDVVIIEEYEGANLDNRLDFLPSKTSVYDKKTGELKSVVTNKFDEQGILVGKIVEDKINNTTKEYEYGAPDSVIENASQGGIGNCFFLETINSLNTVNEGQKIINNAITKDTITDENGATQTIYKVAFAGVPQIKKDLSKGVRNFPEEKIFIKPEYIVTEEELTEASLRAGRDYSAGDKDVLLYEVAYSKYRKDAAETMRVNNESMQSIASSSDLIAGLDIARGWGENPENIGGGGVIGLTMYLFTGRKSDAYFSKADTLPVCNIDSDGNLSAVDGSRFRWATNTIKEDSNVFDKRYDDIDRVMNILKKDAKKDGTFKNYAVEASIAVTSQIINGQEVKGGSHAFTVKAIKGDKVILINPWDSSKEVQISLDDFMHSAQMINMLKL